MKQLEHISLCLKVCKLHIRDTSAKQILGKMIMALLFYCLEPWRPELAHITEELVLARSELRHSGSHSQRSYFGSSTASATWTWQDFSTTMPAISASHSLKSWEGLAQKWKQWKTLCRNIKVCRFSCSS